MAMITKRQVLVVLLCVTMVFAAGCAGWGQDGPADSEENNDNEATGSDSAPNETQENTTANATPDADTDTDTDSDGDSSDSSDSSTGPVDDSSDESDSGTSDTTDADSSADDGSQSPTTDTDTDSDSDSGDSSGDCTTCPDADSDSDSDADESSDTDGDSDSDGESDSDTSDPAAPSDGDGDGDGDGDSDSESDSDSDSDSDTDDNETEPTDPNESTGNETAPNESTGNESDDVYDDGATGVIKVVDKDGEPIEGEPVTYANWSIVQDAARTTEYTDENGEVRISLLAGDPTDVVAFDVEVRGEEKYLGIMSDEHTGVQEVVYEVERNPGEYRYGYTVQVVDENNNPVEGEEVRIGTPGEGLHDYTTDVHGEVTDYFMNSSKDDAVEQEIVVRGESHYMHVERGPQSKVIEVASDEESGNETAANESDPNESTGNETIAPNESSPNETAATA